MNAAENIRKPYQPVKMEVLNSYIGRKFARLTVVSYFGKWTDGSHAFFCTCDCGMNMVATRTNLERGNTRSCGCYAKDRIKESRVIHGGAGTPEYTCWLSIKARCYDVNSSRYPYYGGRGIKMSDEWVNSFEVFLKDMGKKPSKNHSIEREEVDGNYCKENCRWATFMEQSYNKRDTVRLIYKGEMWTSRRFYEQFNINRGAFYSAFLRRGQGVVQFYIDKGVVPA